MNSYLRKTRTALALLALAGTVFTSNAANAKAVGGIDYQAGVISVVGEGLPPQEGSAAKKRLLAKRAAITDAYRKLAEAVQGVQVDSQTLVKQLEVASDEIRTSVSGVIKGARVIEENVTQDGAYEVRVELPMFGDNSLASAVMITSLNNHRKNLPASALLSDEPPPEAAMVAEQAAQRAQAGTAMKTSAYTGIIVDARNLKAKAAMMPALQDEAGHELYVANLAISDDDMVAQGPVSYAKTLDEAKANARVGANPLIIRAKRYKGPFHADLVLGEDEVRQLQAANTSNGLLKKLAVAIVL